MRLFLATITDNCQKNHPPIYILLIIATILLVFVVSFNPRWLDVIISPYSDYKGLPLRIAYLLYSLLICLGIMVIFKRKNKWVQNKFSAWGADTLFFYFTSVPLKRDYY